MRLFPIGLACAACVSTAALGAQGDTLTVQGSRVNVRANPNTGAPVLVQLERGQRVVEIDRHDAWVNVRIPNFAGREGWVHRSLLAPAAAPAAATPGADAARDPGQQAGPVPAADRARPAATVEIQGEGANVRRGPTTQAAVIAKLRRGETLPALAEQDTWVQVELGAGRTGWVHGSLVAPVGPPTAAAAAAVETTAAPIASPPAAEGTTAAGAEAEPEEEDVAAGAEAEPEEVAADPEAREADGERVRVLAQTVSLRREPSRLAPVVARLEQGGTAVVLGREADWVEVAADGGARGWVHSSLVGAAGGDAGETTAATAAAAEREAVGAPPAGAEPAQRQGQQGWVEITSPAVNVRQGPSTEATVVASLNQGRRVVELGREGDWVRVALDDGREGWVYGPLVRPVTTTVAALGGDGGGRGGAAPAPAPSPAEKAPDGSEDMTAAAALQPDGEALGAEERFDRFKTTVASLNDRVRRAAGVDVFAKVEDLGDGTVELTATEAWLKAPEAARRANLDTLFRLWDSVHESEDAIVVRIVDDEGDVAMEKRR